MKPITIELQKILDSFTKELARELDLPKLGLYMKGSFYDIVRDVHVDKMMTVFQPYRDVINRVQKMLWSL